MSWPKINLRQKYTDKFNQPNHRLFSNVCENSYLNVLSYFSNGLEFLVEIFFFFCKRIGGGSFIFILPKIEHTKVITFFPLPSLIFQTGEAEGISLMVLEINETVFGTETCKSGEAAAGE